MSEFYIYQNEAQSGPFTIEQIKEMITQAQIDATVYIYGGNYADWTLINTTQEFSDLFSETYIFYKNDNQIGPFTIDQIKNMLTTSELTPSDYYFDTVINDWKILENSELLNKINTPAAQTTAESAAVSKNSQDAAQPKKIDFPCKNHPNTESFLLCPICGNDFCEQCLIEVNEKHYCKNCYETNKEKINSAGAPKKSGGFLSKLFGKK